MLQRALHDVVAVRVQRELYYARAERASDHRRLSVGPAELRGTEREWMGWGCVGWGGRGNEDGMVRDSRGWDGRVG